MRPQGIIEFYLNHIPITTAVVDDKGVITVYVTQGSDGTYNDGKTAAKYQSSDKGESWVYISQLEITQNQNNQNNQNNKNSGTKTTTAKS